MASMELYPPSIDSIIPAFLASPRYTSGETTSYGTANCRVYFSLSKYSTISYTKIKEIQISTYKLNSSTSSVANTGSFDNNILRENDIIFKPFSYAVAIAEGDKYYIDINEEDICNIFGTKYNYLWEPDQIYKIQIRLSTSSVLDEDKNSSKVNSYYSEYIDGEKVSKTKKINQKWKDNVNKYLVECGQSFSEWSRIATTKAISAPILDTLSPLIYTGGIRTNCFIEYLSEYYYDNSNIKITTEDIKDFDIRISTQEKVLQEITNINPIVINNKKYLYKLFDFNIQDIDLETEESLLRLYIDVNIRTINGFESGYNNEYANYSYPYELCFKTHYSLPYYFYLLNYKNMLYDDGSIGEYDNQNHVSHNYNEDTQKKPVYDFKISSGEQKDNNCIALKIYSRIEGEFLFYILRADDSSNFKRWEIITSLSNVDDEFYDYNISEDRQYKYALQIIGLEGYIDSISPYERTYFTPNSINIESEYSYLLGEDNKQLCLKFNNTINNFKINIGESRQDTIGNPYPYVLRNGKIKYKSFPITGMISSLIDESNLFTEDKILSYDLNTKNEKIFRDAVISFLSDGKPKLFKSSTEGNIIVSLTDISFEPIQSLNRVLYNFSANAFEVDEYNIDNLQKYGIINYTNYALEELKNE